MSEDIDKMAARLKEARQADKRYSTGADAARAMGVEVPTYLGHENASRGFKSSAARYADFYKVNLDWLIAGRGPMGRAGGGGLPAPASVHPSQKSSGDWIKVLGMAECGPDGWSLWNGDVIDHVPRPANLTGAAKAYAVYITGSSMEPRYFPGEVVFVHPDKPVTQGAFVLVQIRPPEDGESPRAVIKRLTKKSGNKWVLEQFNPHKTYTVTSDELISIHRVVGAGEA